MRWFTQIFSRRRIYEEISSSIQQHLDEKIDNLVESGMPRGDAERVARQQFGNVTLIEERSRAVWRWPAIEEFFSDLHFSFRVMMRNPGFTLVVLISLSLGIAATTTIFSAMYSVVIAPPLNKDAGHVVVVWESNKAKGLLRTPVAPATFRDWSESSRSFEGLEVVAPGSPVTVTGSGLPERANIQYATPGLFGLLNVQPEIGRFFAVLDNDAASTVVLSDSFWTRHFARNPKVIGQAITINGKLQTVIGVLPASFHLFDRDTDLWMPIDRPNAQSQDRAFRSWLIAVGRLRPGVTLASAQNEMNLVGERIAKDHPDTNKDWGVKIESLQEAQFGYWNKIIFLLLGIVVCVLLISCANVANLFLGRFTARGREFCLRISLGASRARIVLQLLTEGLFLGLMASVLGCPLAYAGIHLFRASAPANFPLLQLIQINVPTLMFTVIVSLLSGVVTMVSPALFVTRLNVNSALKASGQTTVGRGNSGFRHALVVAEIALSLVLLSGAGLMINSVLRLLRVNPGFDARNVITMQMFLAGPKYFDFDPSVVRIHRNAEDFYRRLIERVETIPGAESVGIVSWLPEMGYNTGRRERGFRLSSQRLADMSAEPSAAFNLVSSDYFKTLRIPLLQGRVFDPRDDASAPWVAVVNEAFIQRFVVQGNPIGQQISIDNGTGEHPRQIVGIVGDVRQNSIDEAATPEIFVPYLQQPDISSGHGYQNRLHMTIVVRSRLEPTVIASMVREIAASMDPDQPVYGIRTMSEVFSDTTSIRRLYAGLLQILSGVALFLSMIGIYGVMSHAVAQRTNEIGLRMAVGATMSDVIRLVFSQGGKLVIAGVFTGLTLAFLLDRFLNAYLFGITAYDPITMVICCAVLVLVACGAIWVPARRASHIDPLIALRYE